MITFDHDKLSRRVFTEVVRYRRWLEKAEAGTVVTAFVVHEDDSSCCRRESWERTYHALAQAAGVKVPTHFATLTDMRQPAFQANEGWLPITGPQDVRVGALVKTLVPTVCGWQGFGRVVYVGSYLHLEKLDGSGTADVCLHEALVLRPEGAE